MSNANSNDLSFVRTEILPERTPPTSAIGVVGWMRANLFSGWFNTLLTLLAILVIYSILSVILPWLISPTWGAQSLDECREIIASTFGPNVDKACWGVINDRWIQLLFGFYPSELYWRPILAFILLWAALAPVLFAEGTPRQFLLVTALYPFVMPWLLWGGTIWTPLAILAGFAIAYGIVRLGASMIGTLSAIILSVVVALIWWLLVAGPLAGQLQSIIPLALTEVTSRDFGGMMLSIVIGVVAIGFSLPIGIILALGRKSNLLIVKALCVGFIEFIRGVPLITLLFVASVLLNIFLPPGTSFDIILRVIIMATIFASAYVAEVIRGGLAALPTGQYEAADALGLDYWRAQRLIIMPQALKISIPGIVSTFIGLFKDTTLVSIIGLLDPLGLSNAIRADTDWNGIVWELYGFIALMFFVFCFSMSRYSMYLERKLQTENR